MRGDAKISLNLDTSLLKLIAAASMVCDHMGKIFFPEVIMLQIIGRISFPLFAYCIVVGALYTKDIKKYMLRLGICAVVSQFIYIQTFSPGPHNLYYYLYYKNVIFTLFTGLLAVYGLMRQKWAVFAAAATASVFLHLDYGVFAVALMLCFYLFREKTAISFVVATTLMAARFTQGTQIELLGFSLGIQGFALLSLPLIYFKTNTSIKINKYFFYAFYPAHLFVIFILQFVPKT